MFGRNRIKLALVDLNGTCHVGDKVVGNATSAISSLIRNHIRVKYVTNTTKGTGTKFFVKFNFDSSY